MGLNRDTSPEQAATRPGPSGVSSIVLILFIAAGVLELFVPRMSDEDSFARLPIQMLSGCTLGVLIAALVGTKKHWNAVTLSFFAMIVLVLIYTLAYVIQGDFQLGAYTPYIRMLLWMASAIFFFEEFLKHKANLTLLRIFIVVTIAGTAKHIVNESVLINLGEFSGGGDTAGLTLLFLLPLVLLFFERNVQIFLLVSIVVLVMLSLRRTAIFGVLLCLPFIYRIFSAKLSAKHFAVLAVVALVAFPYAWIHLGDTLTQRFQELLVGDGGGEKDSYGSGRSIFYLIVLQSWWESGWETRIVGLGLVSVRNMLTAAYGLGHAHNDFLEIAHTFGFVGLGIWFVMLTNLWRLRRKLKSIDKISVNYLYLTLIPYLVVAGTSGGMLRISTLPLSISIAAVTAMAISRRKLV